LGLSGQLHGLVTYTPLSEICPPCAGMPTPCHVVALSRVLLVNKQLYGTRAALERTEISDYTGNVDHRTEP
jgi:hypothetical protein